MVHLASEENVRLSYNYMSRLKKPPKSTPQIEAIEYLCQKLHPKALSRGVGRVEWGGQWSKVTSGVIVHVKTPPQSTDP